MRKQQVVFIHGGDSFTTRKEFLDFLRSVDLDPFQDSSQRWSRHLEESLGERFEVMRPRMPGGNSDEESWSIWFERHIPFMRDGVTLVGHSLGANFLVSYLSEHELNVHTSSLHLVAGCAGEGSFTFPSSGERVERQVKDIIIYHSHDDPIVPFRDAQKYRELLPSAKLLEFSGRGHFLGNEFPELVERIKKASAHTV